MNCRGARRLLPLAAGGDLPPWKSGRFMEHLKKCSGCREELREHQASLEEIRSLARGGSPPEWPESEWRKLMQRATAQGLEKRTRIFALSRRRLAWTLAPAAALMLAAGSVLIFRDGRDREIPRPPTPAVVGKLQVPAESQRSQPKVKQPSSLPKTGPQPPLQAPLSKKQEVVNMIFVSPESGLTIHWVFNSEFEWKEKQK